MPALHVNRELSFHIQRRFCGHLLPVMVAAVAVLVAGRVHADRIIDFTVSSGTIADVRTAAVNVDGMVVMRLRSPDGDGLQEKAETVAERLTTLALAGVTPEEVRVERVDGQWALTGAGSLIVTADAETADASGLSPKALCEGWRARLVEVLREPYLCVKPHELLVVPYNEKRRLRFGGTVSQKPRISSMAPNIARVEPGAKRALVHGRETGATVLILEAGELQHGITVEVKKWAARIAAAASLTALPGGIPEPMIEPAIRNAVLTAVEAQPRAVVRLTDITSTAEGYRAAVRASGAEYLPVGREVIVMRRGGVGPIPAADALFLSNHPEKVDGTGALMRQALSGRTPVRLMWHHKNYAGRQIVLTVRLLNAGAEPARIRVGWAQAGPAPDEIFVGYNAMVRYWQSVRQDAGFLVTLPPRTAYETSAIQMGHHEVVSGLMKLVADAGRDLYVEVLARDPEDAPAGFGAVPGETEQLTVTPYQFPADLEAEVSYEVGGRYGYLSIGREDVENEQGIALAGAYGISHRVRVNASNPTDETAILELALRAGGGVARSLAMVDGTLNRSGILSAGHEQLLHRRRIAPGDTMQIPVEIIPTAGSNLPFTLVVRSRQR